MYFSKQMAHGVFVRFDVFERSNTPMLVSMFWPFFPAIAIFANFLRKKWQFSSKNGNIL
jgi:hypothetical protein